MIWLNRSSQPIFMGVCVSVTHYYCMIVRVCVCVCVCVCAWQTKHLHTVPYKCGCKNSWIACSFKVSSCFVKPKLFNVCIDFKSFNFRPFYMAFHICFTLVRTGHNTGTNITTEFSRRILYSDTRYNFVQSFLNRLL